MSMIADVGSGIEKKSSDVGKSIWTSLLSEVSSRSVTSKLSGEEKNVIIIGDDLSGKTTLAAKLQGVEDPVRVSGLEYQPMEVEDDDNDEKAVCGIWILEGDRSHRSLLDIALPKSRISDTILIITVDMSQPWSIIESVEKWTTIIREHMDQLQMSAEDLANCEKKIVDDFQKYVDPSEVNEESSSIVNSALRLSTSENGDDVAVPLGENTLTCNLGIHLVVICTKCDYTEKLEKDYDYGDEHFDFIQYHLRTLCLKYGAALFYTSVKDNKNMEILHKYLLHKLYGFPFTTSASVVDKDGLFVPSGWDSEKKIGIVSENFVKLSPNDQYDSVISRPISRKTLHDMKEITAEDEQSFLTRAQTSLSAPPTGSSVPRSSVPARTADMSRLKGSQPGRATVAGLTNPIAGKLKAEKPATQSNERVLANFFNSLLNKKPSTSASPQKGTPEPTRQQGVTKQKSPSTSKSPTEAS